MNTEIKIKVPFYDLDPMNIVWHGNYVKYMEEARCDFFDKLNYNYTDMYNIKSANFGEELTVKCFLKEIEPAIVIKYEIYSGSEKIFKASTMQIGVNVKTGETLYEAPEKLRRAVYG